MLATTVSTAAQEQASVDYNVMITDEATGLLASCTEVRVYSVDLVENTRLLADPVVIFPSRLPGASYPAPSNPMFILLPPGRYEMAVRVSWLRAEVHYLYFVVEAEKVSVVDVLAVERPAELVTY